MAAGTTKTFSRTPVPFAICSWLSISTAQGQTQDEFTQAVALPPAIHATRLDYSEFDVPEAVTVLTQEEIRLAGYLEISEIFRSVPGFRIVKIGDESRVSYHGTTVIQNRRMRVSIDGRSVLVGNGQYVEFDRLPLDIADIVAVTITRGPNGAAWGDNAFLASVDFTTSKRDAPRGVAARAAVGANDRQKLAGSLHERVGDVDIAFSAGSEKDGGYDYFDAARTPRDDGRDMQHARLAVERMFGEFGERSLWRLDASAYDSDNQTGIRLLGLSGRQRNDGAFVSISNERELGEFSRLDWFISQNRQRERVRQFGCYTPETIAGALAAVSDPQHRAGLLAPTLFVPALLGTTLPNTCFFTDLDIDSKRRELEIEFESRRGPWRYLAGASASQTDASSLQWFAGRDQRQRSYRAFGESALVIGPLHASLGFMAQDSSNVEQTEWAWRGALNWQFLPNHVLRYSYASSFRVPSLVESETFWTSTYNFGRRNEPLSSYQFSLSSPIATSNVIVRPESIDSHSLGYFGTYLSSRLTADVKVFTEHIRDPIEASFIHFAPPPFNADAFTLSGAEAEFSFRITDRWKVSGQYSYLDTTAPTAFERGMYGRHGASLASTYRLSSNHAFTLAYYGNSEISRNSYDRYDLVYSYSRPFGARMLRTQAILQRHVGGVDGVTSDVALLSNEGRFAHMNQFYVSIELVF